VRYLLAGILYAAVYLGVAALLGGHPLARMLVANALLMTLAGAVCLVVVRRRRQWEGTQRLFWDAFAGGLALWSIGEIGYTAGALTGQRSWVEWHTMFSLCGGIGPVVSMLARPYLGPRKSAAWAVGVDLISYALLTGFVFAYFIMVPSVVPAAGPEPQATLLTLVQMQRFVLVGGLAVCVIASRGTPWRPTFLRLAIGAGLGFFLRLVASGAISGNRYHEGSWYDLAWIVPFACYLWAAIEAPRSAPDVGAAEPRGGWRSVAVSAAPVLFIPLIGFGLLRLQPIGEPGDSVRLLITVLSTVCGLGVLTLRLSLQSGELQRADARVRMMAAATEQTADLILITSNTAQFEHANDACVQALGYTREELAGKTLRDLLERGFERTVDHIGREVRLKGIWRGTLMHRRKDGTTFPAASTVVALRNQQGAVTHFVGVQRDITEELTLRDQLVHSERLSAVGELVAGVAHEINNPLQTIIGCVELMIEERPADPQRDLQLVRQEAARAGQIVRNLLAFVRRSSSQRSVVDLNQIARGIAQLRERHLVDRNVVLRLDLRPGPLPVLVNREEIQQIVLNLVLNAEHAIGDAAGTITIRTHRVEGMHTLQVTDDGPGIDPELRGRVFEPFFTTKDVGEGTGLGLSIALGIATSHGGTLELCTSAKGACFQLTLPAAEPTAPLAGHDSPTPGSEALRPGAEIERPPAATLVAADAAAADTPARLALVVDDEAPIRTLLSRMLRRRGYAVTEVGSHAEMKAAVGAQPFDLVLCDVRLGDGNGADCLRDLRRAQPDIDRRFVFVTGDIAALADHERELGDLRVLAKPFTAGDLDRVLGELAVTV
jgi:PAS domain S-box-containing protein